MIGNGYISLMADVIQKHALKPAFSDFQGVTYTYQEVGERIGQLHQIFEELKIQKGDHIAVVGRNMSGWAISYLSIISYGAVVVPILHDFNTNDIQHIINHSGSVLLFATELQYDKIDEKQMPHLKAIVSIPDFKVLFQSHHCLRHYQPEDGKVYPMKICQVGADEMMVLSYTSGTSGFSKGVMLPHRSIWSNVQFAIDSFDLTAGDKIVSFLPLAHAYGCLFEFLWPFSIGCHITFISKTPSPKIITEAFQEVRPDLILTVPLILEKIFKKNIQPQLEGVTLGMLLKIPGINKLVHAKIRSKLLEVFGGKFREMIVGGAPLNQEVEQFLKLIGFPVTIGYGMTECGPLISYAPWTESRFHSAGKPVHRMEVKILSPDPENQVGEIVVRGENTMLGYYKNEEATREIFDKEGWLHTGDLGVMDQNEFIYIRGRSKSMILGASGQNIYPEEVEAVLNSMDFVQESLVRDMGDGRLEALIYPDYEMADSHNIEETRFELKLQEIRTQANAVLPAYMNISKVTLFSEEFEKTPKKSIKRYIYNIN